MDGKLITTKRNIMFAKWFETLVLILIMLSSVLLCADTPLLNPNSWLTITFKAVDQVFVALFILEAMIKIFAMGFFYNHHPGISGYIMNAWNFLDFFVVLTSIIDFGFSFEQDVDTTTLRSLKALRAIRALRPLRMISRNEGLKVVVNALLASIPAMTNVLMVCLLFLLIFAIMGVNFFKGAFYHCVGIQEETIETLDTSFDCINLGGIWENWRANFDNVFHAMLTLFEMMTTEGWLDVMHHAMNMRGIGL